MNRHTLQHTASRIGDWTVEVWTMPKTPEFASQDACSVQLLPGTGDILRATVCDGLTPSARTPSTAGMDGARYAASLAATAAAGTVDLSQALVEVNAVLQAQGAAYGVPPRENPTTGLVSVDVPAVARTSPWACFTAVYDCEIYVAGQRGWEPLLPATPQNAQIEAERSAWRRAHPTASVEEYVRYDAERLGGDPDAWGTVPLGALEHVHTRAAALPLYGPDGIDQIVLASDGAKLTPQVLAGDLHDWLTVLRQRELADADNQQALKPHDDVTVIRLTLTDR